ncbi:carbamoyltransferase HypF [Aestuariivirga litoralis]|uniref:Carbamoyltransferase HypF n=1 Tax=Aestuariivirga litoralis TaxID=2650924 RepID=A0A2W2AV26_9HYPH|nr:carbamoyltransferase HypF [Aestuariivirga litoralis]PZF76470.1 carbamoyltransferase HypF [Aestuariivirga litoralis]
MAHRIRVTGTVQGVGFRPFVWRLASELGIRGQVLNDGRGVEILAWCEDPEAFATRLRREAPPLARITAITIAEERLGPPPQDFRIVESHASAPATAIAADAATCLDCLAEIRDPAQRRFGHAFANCTNCGPRLSILQRLPYDRANTSMAGFAMCPACASEYADPADRRFHAQPIACPACGPRLWLAEGDAVHEGRIALDRAAEIIRGGGIVAVKGLGGFHLAADARQEETVARLRRSKRRRSRPFALMARDLAEIRRFARLDAQEAAQLGSSAAPILLLNSEGEALAPSVAPGQSTLGFMLPYTPLHHLLLARLDGPIVLTSGNLTDEPQCASNAEAQERLSALCDALLMHDRDIVQRVDDSVLRMARHGPIVIRRARGLAPEPIALALPDAPSVLALGGDLKSSAALFTDGRLTVSQHLGDLSTPLARADFAKMVEVLLALNGARPALVACDLHPDFHASHVAAGLAARFDAPCVRVQHHYAHVLSCLADNGITAFATPVLGVVLDGMGHGNDGTVWGGEFLRVDHAGFQRLAHFPVVPLPGGDAAARQPWRNAVAQLDATLGWEAVAGSPALRHLASKNATALRRSFALSGAHRTSSAGRLLDALAALLGLCVDEQSYEGEAAMLLEACAARSTSGGSYGAERCATGPSWAPLLRGVLDDLERGTAAEIIARRAHDTVIAGVVSQVEAIRDAHAINRVALSGGCFNNVLLSDGISDALAARGFSVLVHRGLPPGDGGLAAGQALAALQARSEGLN